MSKSDDELLAAYQDSTQINPRGTDRFVKNGEYIIERVTDNSLHGRLRVLKYYPEYEKFGELVNEDSHHDLYNALRDIPGPQFDRTVTRYQESETTYFWIFVRDRLGEIWLSDEDMEKIAEIVDKLDQLG